MANLEGVQIHEYPTFADGSMGFNSPTHKLIGIRTHNDDGTEVAQLQRTKTMAHEVAHHFDLSGRGRPPESPPRDQAETEGIAEASAYVVLSHFGLDSGVRSFPYIAHWTKDKRTLKHIMGEIQRVSGTIIGGCEDMLGMDLLPGHTAPSLSRMPPSPPMLSRARMRSVRMCRALTG